MTSFSPYSRSRVSLGGLIILWYPVLLMMAVCFTTGADVPRQGYRSPPRDQVLLKPETVTTGTADLSVYEEMTSDSMESSGHGPNTLDEDLEGLQEDLYDSGVDEWPPAHGQGKGHYIGTEQKQITCFHCHGDGVDGCDVLGMLNDVDAHASRCVGKCLNVSTGRVAAYDCAHDITHNVDGCIKRGGMEICFCTGDFCNGPSDLKRFTDKDRTTLLFPDQHPTWNETADYNHGEDYDVLYDPNDNETEITADRKISTSRRNHSGSRREESNKARVFSPLLEVIDQVTNEIRKDHRGQGRKFDPHQADNLYSENLKTTTNEHRGASDENQKEKNVVIPAKFGEDNSTEEQVVTTTSYPVENNEPSVGKLKDSPAGSENSGEKPSVYVFIIILFNIYTCVLPYL